MKTTPAAADPAIRGSCSLSSDLKSSALEKQHKETDRQYYECRYRESITLCLLRGLGKGWRGAERTDGRTDRRSDE